MIVRARRIPLILALLLTLGGGAGCSLHRAKPTPVAATAQTDGKVHLTIVATNDVHGWIEPHEPAKPGGESLVGGFDIFASYVKVLRKQRPDGVILLDGGDLFQGTLVANRTEGAAVIRAFNALGYDATAIGNHEFDYGPEGEPVTAVTPSEDPIGNLKARIAEAHFPMLAGNIFDRSTGAPVNWENAPRTTMIRRQGVSIGIIGLTTPTTPAVTLVQNVKGLEFKPLVPVTIDLAKRLRAEGAKIVIVTMHAGAGCPLGSASDDLSKCEGGELFPYLNDLPEGTVDAVVAGHTHQFLAHFVKGVPVIQSKSYADAFGVIELTYDTNEKQLDRSATTIWKPTPLCRKVFADTKNCKEGSGPLTEPVFLGEKIVPDEATAQAMRPDVEKIAALKSEKLGPILREPFTRNRTAESTLGDLVTDVMRAQFAKADVAIFNSGGLRADLNAGPLTYGRVFSALPFDNRFAVLKLTGAELLAMLSTAFSGEHGVLQLSGLSVEAVEPGAATCTPGVSRVLSVKLADGKPLNPTAVYTVVTNDFVAGGGDGYNAVLKNVDPLNNMVRHDLPPLREVVVTYFRLHPQITGPEGLQDGRIRYTKPICAKASGALR